MAMLCEFAIVVWQMAAADREVHCLLHEFHEFHEFHVMQ